MREVLYGLGATVAAAWVVGMSKGVITLLVTQRSHTDALDRILSYLRLNGAPAPLERRKRGPRSL